MSEDQRQTLIWLNTKWINPKNKLTIDWLIDSDQSKTILGTEPDFKHGSISVMDPCLNVSSYRVDGDEVKGKLFSRREKIN